MILLHVIDRHGHGAGKYDHQGNFGYVIVGEPTYESLVERARQLGHVIRKPCR